jgi:hypothetical protein
MQEFMDFKIKFEEYEHLMVLVDNKVLNGGKVACDQNNFKKSSLLSLIPFTIPY